MGGMNVNWYSGFIQVLRDFRENFTLRSKWEHVDEHVPSWVRSVPWEKCANGCMVDVGCHYGYVSVYYIRKTNQKSFGFDVNPRIHSLLEKNIMHSPYAGKFLVQKYGLANENATTDYFSDTQYSGLTTIKPSQNMVIKNFGGPELSRKGTATVRKLDDNSVGEKIAFIKLDCEGSEPDVLRGAIKTIRRDKPMIVFEKLDETNMDCETILSKEGYQFRPLDKRNYLAIAGDLHDLS